MSRKLHPSNPSPPLRFRIREQQYPERVDVTHRPQNRIQQRDDRNPLTILLAMSGDIQHNSTAHGKAAAPFDEIGDTTILQLTRPWEPPLSSTRVQLSGRSVVSARRVV
jgi:hypothetical protein